MLTTYARRVAAAAVLSAALTAGSLGLTATAASACSGSPRCNGGPPPAAAATMGCTTPECIRGVPPVAAPAMECTDPRCVSGTQPAVAYAGASTAINCPPPNPKVTALTRDISDC